MTLRNEERGRYIIPKNFLDYGYVFGGRFKLRNFIEASVITAPVFAVFAIGWKFLGWKFSNTIAACVIICAAVFLACVNGVAGDSLLEFLIRVKKFKETKQISKYNPRVKHENEPDYLMVKGNTLPREKILQFGKNLANKFIGEDIDVPISKDISDDHLITFFEDDDGIVEKPKELKSRAELKADAKKEKAAERERRREEKEFLKTLPAKERREKKRAFRLEARVRHAEALRLANEQKAENDRRVKEVLALAQEKKAELYKKAQAEKKQVKIDKKNARLEEKRKKREARADSKRIKQEAKRTFRKKPQNHESDIREADTVADTCETVMPFDDNGEMPTEKLTRTPKAPELETVLPFDTEQQLFEDEETEEESTDALIQSFELTFFEEEEPDDNSL